MNNVLIILLATGTLLFQQALCQDNPLRQPLLDGAGHPREDAYQQIPLRPDDQIYAGIIEGSWMKQVLMELDRISLDDKASGRLFWGRNLGTAAHEIAQVWAEAYFAQFGLENIQRRAFALDPVWVVDSWDVRFSSGLEEFRLTSACP
ncbi:MAG: hypothetical protein R3F50_03695 [Gammaproteobacteria bacterium]|jgi:hypothetical protein